MLLYVVILILIYLLNQKDPDIETGKIKPNTFKKILIIPIDHKYQQIFHNKIKQILFY